MAVSSFPLSCLPGARRTAVQTLYHCLYSNQDLQAALDKALTATSHSPADAGLATALAYGYLRNKTRSDFLVASFLKAPGKLPSSLLLVLGVAAYELACMDAIPAYATVDWAVEWTKKHWGKRLAGVTNAVLRKTSGLGKTAWEMEYCCKDDPDTLTLLSRFYSCPAWIVKIWLTSYGQERTRELLEESVVRPALGLRCVSEAEARRLEQVFASDVLARCGTALALKRTPDNLDTLLQQGRVACQSYAAQTALHALGPGAWPTPVWDACCGRGGKSMMLWDENISPLWASDKNASRLGLFLRECKKSGKHIPLFRASATATSPFAVPPKTILLDAPCSGLGVLSRRPDSKWKRTPKDVQRLIQTQRAMLDNAWAGLQPGGILAYITCTLNPQENQEQIAWLCRNQNNAVVMQEYETGRGEGFGEYFYGAVIHKGL